MYTGANTHGTADLMKSEGTNERLCSVADPGGGGGGARGPCPSQTLLKTSF